MARAVLITNKSLSEEDTLLMAVIPPGTFNNPTSIFLLQADDSTLTCPQGHCPFPFSFLHPFTLIS